MLFGFALPESLGKGTLATTLPFLDIFLFGLIGSLSSRPSCTGPRRESSLGSADKPGWVKSGAFTHALGPIHKNESRDLFPSRLFQIFKSIQSFRHGGTLEQAVPMARSRKGSPELMPRTLDLGAAAAPMVPCGRGQRKRLVLRLSTAELASAGSLIRVAPPMGCLDIVRMVVSPRSSHTLGILVVGHHVGIVRELFVADRTLLVLFDNLAVQQFPHLCG